MTDNRKAIGRKFQALQRFSQLYRNRSKTAIEAVVFASEKADIGKVSVVGMLNIPEPPKLVSVFATGKRIRYNFWQKIYARLGEDFEPPVTRYDAIEAEKIFARASAKPGKKRWVPVLAWSTAVAALVFAGFFGAQILGNLALVPSEAAIAGEAAADDGLMQDASTESAPAAGLISPTGSPNP